MNSYFWLYGTSGIVSTCCAALGAPGMCADFGGGSPLYAWQRGVLAKGKGVRREAESEGSRRQSPDLTNRNHIQGRCARVSLHNKTKPYRCPERTEVNVAGTWDEGLRSYPGRSVSAGGGGTRKCRGIGRQKSAEAIVPQYLFEKLFMNV